MSNDEWRIQRENEERYLVKLYESLNWKLICIARNNKIPVKGVNWTERTLTYENAFHLLGNRMNIAVNLKESGLIVADIDVKIIPNKLRPFMQKTMFASSPHGYHFIFKYDKEVKELPEIELCEWRGGFNKSQYILISPSSINKIYYEWLNELPLMSFSQFLKEVKM